jgi:SecD/SecF fusion protein
MERQKSWQFYLIIAVIILTLYNILPTVFYYTKPLKEPIDAPRAHLVANEIIDRVNDLEADSKAWIQSFCNLLGISPKTIELNEKAPRFVDVTFNNEQDADLFRQFLPRAGNLIPFVPKQLELNPLVDAENPNKVRVNRKIWVHLNPSESDQMFQFGTRLNSDGKISEAYRALVYDRVVPLVLNIAGPSQNGRMVSAVVESGNDPRFDSLTLDLSQQIVATEKAFGKNSAITKRIYASFSQINAPAGSKNQETLIPKFLARVETLKVKLNGEKENLVKEQKQLQEKQTLLDASKVQTLAQLESQTKILEQASTILRQNIALFSVGKKPLTEAAVQEMLAKSLSSMDSANPVQSLDLSGYNPFFDQLVISWNDDSLQLNLYDDIQEIRSTETKSEAEALLKETLGQEVINEVARISQISDETIQPHADQFAIVLNKLSDTSSFLALNLGVLAKDQSKQIFEELKTAWMPQHPDLTADVYPLLSYGDYLKLPEQEQKLGLVVYAPSAEEAPLPEGFRKNSIYVIARGLDTILQKHKDLAEEEAGQAFLKDFTALNQTMQQNGFIGYPGSSFGIDPQYSKDYIFELNDYYGNLIKATRENFAVKGSKRSAILDFTDVEQRILTLNKIEDRIQEDLLKWKEEYTSAQVDLNATSKYAVPAPTQNPYWANFKLSFVKYFRGDDRKILKWGLDLSGGKTVRIGLRDQNNREVTNPNDIQQAVNELYNRINSMGVSERTIRVEGSNILLDFPGSQGLSAADLVKASAMYFHIVNEKFTSNNPELAESVNRFLQEVWNEAVVTNRKDVESINAIAWEHLGGGRNEGDEISPLSENAKKLHENGLRLANPKQQGVSSTYDDSLSSIAIFRGEDFSEWHGQTHPLLVVFHNYALEGANLENIQSGYDNTEGNILLFSVKGSDKAKGINPRDDFYAWTSHFAEEKIVGTPLELYSAGRGWRMAVILNGSVISAPTLRAALRDHASISGRFSQREVNQLVADLKAGSLSFTPRILSEQNVSPELGKEERFKGISASLVALILVVAVMVGYYRFAGVVASCAVLLNLLILWGVLQNLGAALTLPGIAGIVLTMGMAVDANVLVFERIREEFKVSGRIGSAIQAGYRKAFSAIFDSNITTIIAALILIQFDSGPIKAFAVTLIIGIISSMFTALFVTRYYFAGWVKDPKHKELKMSQFISNTNFDFLAHAKKVIISFLVVIAIGTYFLIAQHRTIFGMDFTGGYSLTVELQEKPNTNYRLEATRALISHGAASNDFEIRELSRPNQLRIQLATRMEEKGHPFYGMTTNRIRALPG